MLGIGPLSSAPLSTIPATGSATSLTPGAGSIVITGHAPVISWATALVPVAGNVVLTGHTPTITAGTANINLAPGVGSITNQGYAPSIQVVSKNLYGGADDQWAIPDTRGLAEGRKAARQAALDADRRAMGIIKDPEPEPLPEIQADPAPEPAAEPVAAPEPPKPMFDFAAEVAKIALLKVDEAKSLELADTRQKEAERREWIARDDEAILLCLAYLV